MMRRQWRWRNPAVAGTVPQTVATGGMASGGWKYFFIFTLA